MGDNEKPLNEVIPEYVFDRIDGDIKQMILYRESSKYSEIEKTLAIRRVIHELCCFIVEFVECERKNEKDNDE